jgi:hypothetical protein
MLGFLATDIRHRGAAVLLLSGPLVARVVEGEAKTIDPLDYCVPEAAALLADAASEDEGIDPALEGDVVASDKASNAVYEEVEGEGMLGLAAGGNGSEVGGAGEG